MNQRLLAGVTRYREAAHPARRELFRKLASGQHPHTLFITCSDSRIDPALLTQTEPGELFVIRNAGNLVPPWGAPVGGEAATLEYGVKVLGVASIVVCGHSHCGAMAGLLEPESLSELPAVSRWLVHARETRRRLGPGAGPDAALRLDRAIQENVRVQLDHLRSYPFVEERVADGALSLHGWVYRFEEGAVLALEGDAFKPLPTAAEAAEGAAR